MSNLLPSIFNKDPLFYFPSFLQELEQFQKGGGKDQGLTIYDEKNNIVVEAALPGLKSEEIDINLNKGTLWIKGEKKEEATDKDKKFYKKSVRSFSYSIALPEQVDENQEPEASYKDGILKISFPKAKTSEAKRINIKKNNH
jgi:HSP20 family protein